MNLTLRPLRRSDSHDDALYDMAQECPAEENGFLNGAFGLTREGYAAWVLRHEEIARGIDLPTGFVRQTIYWLYDGDRPVGSAKLRHALTDALRIEGGNIGYGIRPTERNKGYGRALLRLMLAEAGRQGLDRVLVTINNMNLPSLRVARANGGRLDRRTAERSYFWFDTPTEGAPHETVGT